MRNSISLTSREFLAYAHRWVYLDNVLRPHFGEGMNGRPPLSVLQSLGYTGRETIAFFPPLILDTISTDLLLACDPEEGNDLLANYIPPSMSNF